MPWWVWVVVGLVAGGVGVVKGKRTRRRVWRAWCRYAQKRKAAKEKAHARRRRQQRVAAAAQPVRRSAPGSAWKPAPLAPAATRVARRPVLRVQRCSLACRQSRKPAATCDCACGGRDHGRFRTGTKANVMAQKITPAQKKMQRAAEATKRKADNDRRSAEAARRRQAQLNKLPTPQRGSASTKKG